MTGSKTKLMRWIERHPYQASSLVPWFFGMLPISLLPTHVFVQLGGLSLVREVADLAPMVRYMSARASNPAWTQKMLACMWALGPLWIVSTVVIFLLSLKAGVAKRKEGEIGQALLVGAIFVLLMLVFAHVRVRPWKRSDVMEFIFVNEAGLFLAGWYCISFPFVVFGLLACLALTRPTREKNG